jgi:hypothetical protein
VTNEPGITLIPRLRLIRMASARGFRWFNIESCYRGTVDTDVTSSCSDHARSVTRLPLRKRTSGIVLLQHISHQPIIHGAQSSQ